MKEYLVKLEYTGIEDVYVKANNQKKAIEQAKINSRMRAEGAEISVYEIENNIK